MGSVSPPEEEEKEAKECAEIQPADDVELIGVDAYTETQEFKGLGKHGTKK